ncbi:polyprenyl synthetase family protein [Pseudoclavibacter sp. CFCC 14310]|uniref:polyprenyl synthetase family protein n=1 Tax=Pseudoclavibacter sp. CFCC 14310 TaxID=2615180 RepID=UPI0013016F6D|nr:polyprenyl synthetase family protein [Pseudoclavibacter sp. CFCC 14310]KAB1643762.1 polyprenyl synthetase family protein [Pseudoclavibacter sp. CFCC 14310]
MSARPASTTDNRHVAEPTRPHAAPITLADVDERLQQGLDASLRQAAQVDDRFVQLWQALRSGIGGGKRVRPALLIDTFTALGGPEKHREACIEAAAALEMLHAAFLLHDDLIDGDLLRRGRPNAIAEFSARGNAHSAGAGSSWGLAAGTLGGDLLLSSAIRRLAGVRVEDRLRDQLLDEFDETIHLSAAGELADVTQSLISDASPSTGRLSAADAGVSPLEPTRSTVQQTARPQSRSTASAQTSSVPPLADEALCQIEQTLELKTARYSFVAPVRIGAMLAGADARQISNLSDMARHAGIAFQLTDDLIGVFGDADITGKSTKVDLQRGTRTALIAVAQHTAVWAELETMIGDPTLDDARAARARDLLNACGARAAVELRARDHLRLSRSLLEDESLPPRLRDCMQAHLDAIAGRQR